MTTVKISIIIPVYNAEIYLRECIDSVLCQDFRDMELILVDDGSTDNSGSICDEYSTEDSRVKVIHGENKGVSVARNKAIDISNGLWVFFCDSDDILMPNALQNLFDATINADNTDIILGCSYVLKDGKYKPLNKLHIAEYKNSYNNMSHSALWGYLFRASLIKKNNIRFVPGLAYTEDGVFMTTYSIQSRAMKTIPAYVYAYRKHNTSACANKDGVMKASHQFRAARCIYDLYQAEVNQEKKSYLKMVYKRYENWGVLSYTKYTKSFKRYPEYNNSYTQFFPHPFRLLLKTLYWIPIAIKRSLI